MMTRRHFAMAMAGLFAVAACSDQESTVAPEQDQTALAPLNLAEENGIEGSYIVVLNDDEGEDEIGSFTTNTVATEAGGTAETVEFTIDPEAIELRANEVRTIAATEGIEPTHVFAATMRGFSADMTNDEVAALRTNANVKFIEQDQVVEAAGNRTQRVSGNGPWGLDRISQRGRNLSGSYTYRNTGRGVNVYVIDSGIRTSHPEFGGRARNVWSAYGSGDDCYGHGTAVAATIGGNTYGVAKQANLHGLRVFNCSRRGTSTNTIRAIEWVRMNGRSPAVVNMSLSMGESWGVNFVTDRLSRSGVFVVAAAGNNNRDTCRQSPAGAPGAYTVAATSQGDNRWSRSNHGRCVDAYAPGVGVRSAWFRGGSMRWDGTSIAAPHAAGVAALFKAQYGNVRSDHVAWWLNRVGTSNTIRGNRGGTPNRLLFTGGL